MITDNDMVHYFDAHQLAGLNDAVTDAEVFRRWLGIAAGVVMNNDDSSRTAPYSRFEHLPNPNLR